MRLVSDPTAILTAQAATGVGEAIGVKGYHHILVAVSAAVNASLTFKFQGSIGKSATDAGAPDFSMAQTIENHWDYVASYDLQSPGSLITGDTGVTLNNDTVAGNTRLYMINVDALTWFSMDVTSVTDGDVSAFFVGYLDDKT